MKKANQMQGEKTASYLNGNLLFGLRFFFLYLIGHRTIKMPKSNQKCSRFFDLHSKVGIQGQV